MGYRGSSAPAKYRNFTLSEIRRNSCIDYTVIQIRDKRLSAKIYGGEKEIYYTDTHQADEYAKELNDVGVSDGVETTEEGVENRDAGAQDDGGALVHVDDDRQRSAEGREDARRPEHLAAESRQEEEAAHALPERVLKRIQHRNVPLLSHLVREENTTCDRIAQVAHRLEGCASNVSLNLT